MNATDQTKQDARQAADKVSEEGRKLADTARSEAQKLADTAKDVGRDQAETQLERGKHVVGDQMETVEHALESAAERLRDDGSPLAGYASDLAERLSGLSSRIESATLDDLAGDAKRLSRENPGMFMLGAVALGFAASRFLKASERTDRDYVSDRIGSEGSRGGRRDAYDDYPSESAGGNRYGAYRAGDGYRSPSYDSGDMSGDAYRSPTSAPAGPRDDLDATPRVPMDSAPVDPLAPVVPSAPGSTPSSAASTPSSTGTGNQGA